MLVNHWPKRVGDQKPLGKSRTSLGLSSNQIGRQCFDRRTAALLSVRHQTAKEECQGTQWVQQQSTGPAAGAPRVLVDLQLQGVTAGKMHLLYGDGKETMNRMLESPQNCSDSQDKLILAGSTDERGWS